MKIYKDTFKYILLSRVSNFSTREMREEVLSNLIGICTSHNPI